MVFICFLVCFVGGFFVVVVVLGGSFCFVVNVIYEL